MLTWGWFLVIGLKQHHILESHQDLSEEFRLPFFCPPLKMMPEDVRDLQEGISKTKQWDAFF